MASDGVDYSLADFFISDSPSVLDAPEDFLSWQHEGRWARKLFEPLLGGPAIPRTSLIQDGRPKPVLNFGSYNYLGLTRHPDVMAAAHEALDTYGTGMCGPPMLSGQNELHGRLADRLSGLVGREATILFTSGYGGGVGAVAGVVRRGDVVAADEKCHMSLVDGAKLAQARLVFFEHNNPDALDRALAGQKDRRKLVVVEGLYSMDGDIADLPALLDVAESHRASVLIDEAHSILTCGPSGAGVAAMQGVEKRIGLFFASLSKAFGGVGGFVSSSASTLSYLRHYSNPYLFSAGMPPAVVGGLLAALDVAENNPGLRDQLWANAEYMRTNLQTLGLNTGPSRSYIIPVIVGDDRRLLFETCNELRERGLFIPPVDYPVVAADQLRFRVAITALHQREDLDQALNLFEDVLVPRLRSKNLLRGVSA